MIVVGSVTLKKIGDVKHVFDDGDHPGFYPAAIIALGALVFVIAFFGCCGAIRESRKFHFLSREMKKFINKFVIHRMSFEPLLSLPSDNRCASSSLGHFCACLQPGHPTSCFQGLGSFVGWTTSF